MTNLFRLVSGGVFTLAFIASPMEMQAKFTPSSLSHTTLQPMQMDDEIPLTITRSDEFEWGGEDLVAGKEGVTFLESTLANAGGDEVLITEITAKNYGSGNAIPFSNFTFAIFVDGEQQGASENPDANGLSYFDLSQSGITIPAESSEEFTLIMDTVVASAPGSIMTTITEVDAENTETQESVSTYRNGSELSFGNPLPGRYFTLVEFGTLTVSREQVVPSNVLVAGEEDVNVFRIRLSAQNDEILVKDIYLENDINNDGTPDNTGIQNRVDFKLYNQADQLIETELMVGGTLHFELAEQNWIHVPEGGSTIVTVKADVRNISRADQTGKRLRLTLDADGSQNNFKGIEAVTAMTGEDIPTPNTGWGDSVSENFVAYRTELFVEHADQQVPFRGPSGAMQELYRFTVSADEAAAMELGRLTMKVDIDGMERNNGNFLSGDFGIYRVVNGVADTGNEIADVTVEATTATSTYAKLTVDFDDENFAAGQSRTFALFVGNTVNDGQNQGNDDSISITFSRDTSYSAPTSRAGQNGRIVVWSDRSDPAHTDNTSDWLSGYLTNIDTSAHINLDVD